MPVALDVQLPSAIWSIIFKALAKLTRTEIDAFNNTRWPHGPHGPHGHDGPHGPHGRREVPAFHAVLVKLSASRRLTDLAREALGKYLRVKCTIAEIPRALRTTIARPDQREDRREGRVLRVVAAEAEQGEQGDRMDAAQRACAAAHITRFISEAPHGLGCMATAQGPYEVEYSFEAHSVTPTQDERRHELDLLASTGPAGPRKIRLEYPTVWPDVARFTELTELVLWELQYSAALVPPVPIRSGSISLHTIVLSSCDVGTLPDLTRAAFPALRKLEIGHCDRIESIAGLAPPGAEPAAIESLSIVHCTGFDGSDGSDVDLSPIAALAPTLRELNLHDFSDDIPQFNEDASAAVLRVLQLDETRGVLCKVLLRRMARAGQTGPTGPTGPNNGPVGPTVGPSGRLLGKNIATCTDCCDECACDECTSTGLT